MRFTILLGLSLLLWACNNDDDTQAPDVDQGLVPDAATGGGGAAGQAGEGGIGGFGGEGGAIGPPLGPHNTWGPSARIVYLEIPRDRASAIAAGCELVGESLGTSLQLLASIAGEQGLAQFVTPNLQTGEIPLLLMAQLHDWEEGLRVDELESSDLSFYFGALGEGGSFWVHPSSFIGEDPEQNALVFFEQLSILGQWLEFGPVNIPIPMPRLNSELNISQLELAGSVEVWEPGFALFGGKLSGYLTEAAFLEFLQGMLNYCFPLDETPPEGMCQRFADFLRPGSDPQSVLSLFQALGLRFDARIEEGTALDCDPDLEGDCNAVALCTEIVMEGIEIQGIAEEP